MKKNSIIFLVVLFTFLSCSKDDNGSTPVLPTITTNSISDIAFTTAISGGNITNDGGATVTSRGICWSTSPNPTVTNTTSGNGDGVGIFNSSLNGLIENTTYYVRAFAVNSAGTAYGNELSFTTNETMYFPPNDGSSTWTTKSIADLGWNQSSVQPLLDYLDLKHTKSFIILVNGRIVMENYFNGHTATTLWQWNSAGKTLTSTITGIAQQEGLININNKVSDYLGTGWTSAPLAKENLILCKNLLSMNSGLDDTLGDDVSPANLQYVADAGSRWAYHNVYVKLQDVVEQASGQTWNAYFNAKLRNKIGMSTNGLWYNATGANFGLRLYYSNTRSMARFGLLALNKGKWNSDVIINEAYLNQASNTSQSINQAYGYLWWLNGKTSYHLPQTQLQFNGSLIATGPSDMFMALGKDDQKIYVIPSKKMVVIRMGEAADSSNLALSNFDETLWTKISALYQ